MFINEDFDNFEYVVDYSDNYVVLSNRSRVNGSFDNPQTIPVIVQYLYPSTLVIEDTRTFRTSTEFNSIDSSSGFFNRPDCPFILLASFFIVLLTCVVINQVTEFICKGGICH